MRFKDLVKGYINYMRSIPVDTPLNAEELLLEKENGLKSTKKKKSLDKK